MTGVSPHDLMTAKPNDSLLPAAFCTPVPVVPPVEKESLSRGVGAVAWFVPLRHAFLPLIDSLCCSTEPHKVGENFRVGKTILD